MSCSKEVHIRTLGGRWRTTLALVITLMPLSGCGLSSYPYTREDSVYVNGIQYKTEINSALYFETGFSPDIGSKRVNTTRSRNGSDYIYQIDLPGGAGIWIADTGLPGQEQAFKAGAEILFHPEAVLVDNVANPTHWHAITKRCDGDTVRTECFDDTVARIQEHKAANKQKKAPVTYDYWQSDDNVVRVFAAMQYYVCDEDVWRKSKRLNALFFSRNSLSITVERNHQNSYTAGEALLPCDTKNNAKMLASRGNGTWEATDLPLGGDRLYVGSTKYKNVHDSYNSGFEMDNGLFFRRVVLPSGKTVETPENGAVTLAFDPTTKKILILGINQYSYMKFFIDQ